MEPDESDRGRWRRDGGPTAGEFALALVLVVLVALGSVVVLGGQISDIVSVSSRTI